MERKNNAGRCWLSENLHWLKSDVPYIPLLYNPRKVNRLLQREDGKIEYRGWRKDFLINSVWTLHKLIRGKHFQILNLRARSSILALTIWINQTDLIYQTSTDRFVKVNFYTRYGENPFSSFRNCKVYKERYCTNNNKTKDNREQSRLLLNAVLA